MIVRFALEIEAGMAAALRRASPSFRARAGSRRVPRSGSAPGHFFRRLITASISHLFCGRIGMTQEEKPDESPISDSILPGLLSV